MALAAHEGGHRARPRRHVHPVLLRILRVGLFRYSYSREAYVLRIVGDRWGPVLRSSHPDTPA